MVNAIARSLPSQGRNGEPALLHADSDPGPRARGSDADDQMILRGRRMPSWR